MKPALVTTPTGQYKSIISGLNGRLTVLQTMHEEIKNSFNDYKLLGPMTDIDLKRRKRKVLGFVGDLMGDIFGVVTEGDISSITRHIGRLSRNQLELTHVVEESISILNVSRLAIKENRQKINDLITVVVDIEDEIINMSDNFQQTMHNINTAMVVFSKLDSIIEEIKNAISRSMYFYTQLQIQSAVMKKLSPTTIPADTLRNVIGKIQEKLPQTVGLPANPRTELFDYSKLLSCVPILMGSTS